MDGNEGQELEKEHGEEARSEDVEGKAPGEKGQEVAPHGVGEYSGGVSLLTQIKSWLKGGKK